MRPFTLTRTTERGIREQADPAASSILPWTQSTEKGYEVYTGLFHTVVYRVAGNERVLAFAKLDDETIQYEKIPGRLLDTPTRHHAGRRGVSLSR